MPLRGFRLRRILAADTEAPRKQRQGSRRRTMYGPYIVEESRPYYQAQLHTADQARRASQFRQFQVEIQRERSTRIGRGMSALQHRLAAWLMSGKAATPAAEIW